MLKGSTLYCIGVKVGGNFICLQGVQIRRFDRSFAGRFITASKLTLYSVTVTLNNKYLGSFRYRENRTVNVEKHNFVADSLQRFLKQDKSSLTGLKYPVAKLDLQNCFGNT